LRIEELPRTPLAEWPTPLQALPRLTAALGGPHLWVKRDDRTSLATGGNKVRKLEYLLGHALQLGATAVITTGAHTSNHAALTVAACRRLGLHPYLVLRQPPAGAAQHQGNLLLDELLGACIHWVPDGAPEAAAAAMQAIAWELRQAGEVPYIIVVGGSVGRGAIGYTHAIQEVGQQAAAAGFQPTTIVTASGSGGTQAGLLVGTMLHGMPTQILGVMVGDDDIAAFRKAIADIGQQACALLGIAAHLPPVELLGGYAGPGYGQVNQQTLETIRLVARTEGLLLDPVYTGKAMAGLIGELHAGRWCQNDHVIFLHTGGQNALFSYAEALLRP